jgi:hypothetical protein
VKTCVFGATGNRGVDLVLSLVACEWPGPPDTPICGHTDKEQALALFPEDKEEGLRLHSDQHNSTVGWLQW